MTHAHPSAPPHGTGRTPARAAAAGEPKAPLHGHGRGPQARPAERAQARPQAASAASAGRGRSGGWPR